MGLSIARRILTEHKVSGSLESGSELTIKIDQTLTQDATGTMTYLQLEAMNAGRLKTDLSVSYVDHNTLQEGHENADDHKYLQTVAAKISQFAFDELDAPPVLVGARNWITPADEVEDAFFPYPPDMLDAIHEHILPLSGYAVQRPCDSSELLRRSREGI